MYVHGEPVRKLIIELAPTGMVPHKSDCPNVPITPDEIINDTYEAFKLGATMVHVHARRPDSTPTHSKAVYAEIIRGIRDRCPGMIICASTSGRESRDIGKRVEVLELHPEMASLMLGNVNFRQSPSLNTVEDIVALASVMRDLGIKPELEVFEPGFINMAIYLHKKGYIRPPMHFNLMLGSLGSIQADMRDMVYLVESLPPGSTWTATGVGRFQLQINAAAIIMGGHVRVGLEDEIYYDRGGMELATNAQLVQRIVRIAGDLGREIARPGEARQMLGMP